MPDLVTPREDPASILRSAYSFGNGPQDADDNIEDAPEPVEETEEETTDDDVDNNEQEVDDADDESEEDSNEDEDEEEADEEDEDAEGEDDENEDDTEEPEDEDEYDSGYLYFNDKLKKKVFLHVLDPETGEQSIYPNRKKAEEGLSRSFAFIGELKKQVEEERETAQKRISQLEKDLHIYQMTGKPDELKSALVKSKMPERFRNADPKTLSDSEFPEYRSALLEAELAVEKEIRLAREEEDSRTKKEREAEDRATTHVRNRTNDIEFFGLTNTEDRYLISKRMKEKPKDSEYSYSDMAVSISKAYGDDIADVFIKAVVQDVISSEEPEKSSNTPVKKTTGKTKTNSKPTISKKEKVEKLKKKVKVKRVVPSKSGDKTKMPGTARDIMNAAFALGKK